MLCSKDFNLTEEKSFYDVLNFLVDRDRALFTDEQIKALLNTGSFNNNIFSKFKKLKSDDSYNIISQLLALLHKLNVEELAPKFAGDGKAKQLMAHKKKIQDFKEFLCKIYGQSYIYQYVDYRNQTMINQNAPSYAKEHFEHLVQMEKNLEDSSSLEAQRYVKHIPNISRNDLVQFFNEVQEVYSLKITPSHLEQLTKQLIK